jgi:hypothetical protein
MGPSLVWAKSGRPKTAWWRRRVSPLESPRPHASRWVRRRAFARRRAFLPGSLRRQGCRSTRRSTRPPRRCARPPSRRALWLRRHPLPPVFGGREASRSLIRRRRCRPPVSPQRASRHPASMSRHRKMSRATGRRWHRAQPHRAQPPPVASARFRNGRVRSKTTFRVSWPPPVAASAGCGSAPAWCWCSPGSSSGGRGHRSQPMRRPWPRRARQLPPRRRRTRPRRRRTRPRRRRARPRRRMPASRTVRVFARVRRTVAVAPAPSTTAVAAAWGRIASPAGRMRVVVATVRSVWRAVARTGVKIGRVFPTVISLIVLCSPTTPPTATRRVSASTRMRAATAHPGVRATFGSGCRRVRSSRVRGR